MLIGRRFPFPAALGLACLNDGAIDAGDVAELLVDPASTSSLIGVPSALFTVIFDVRAVGTNVFEFAFKRGIDADDGVGGGEAKPPILFDDECEWFGGGWGAWFVGTACDGVGVLGPWSGGGGFRGDIGIPL